MKKIKSLLLVLCCFSSVLVSSQNQNILSRDLVDYETGKVTMDELKGNVIAIISPEEILFQEHKTKEKITLRLAYIESPQETHFYYNKTLSYIRGEILNKEVEVLLFNFNPKTHAGPAALIDYMHEKVLERNTQNGGVYIGKFAVLEPRTLNIAILEGGFAKAIAKNTIPTFIDAENKAKEYKIGVWSNN